MTIDQTVCVVKMSVLASSLKPYALKCRTRTEYYVGRARNGIAYICGVRSNCHTE